MRFLRTLLVFKLGAYAGLGPAALMKRALPSEDAPRLILDGMAVLGGVAVGTKPPGP